MIIKALLQSIGLAGLGALTLSNVVSTLKLIHHPKVTTNQCTSFSLLHTAVLNGDPQAVELFIQSGADVNAVDLFEMTPLDYAAQFGYLLIAKLLIQAGAHVNAINTSQNPPLYFAAKHGHLLTVELLIQAGANVNETSTSENSPLYLAFFDLMRLISLSPHYASSRIDSLMRLLSWYIYQTCTDKLHLSPENHDKLFRLLKSSYQSSVVLQQLNPLLSWLFTKMLDCDSKKKLIENILEYLNAADKEHEDVLIEQIDYLFLKKEILEEFNSNFNVFKKKFSLTLLEKLKSISRYRYAQKIKCKIFNTIDEKFIDQFIDSATTPLTNDTQHIKTLANIRDALIDYCQRTRIKSPFVNKVIGFNQSNRHYKITQLAQKYASVGSLTDREFSAISKAHIEDTLRLVKNVKVHLDYIIQERGVSLSSPTLFGMNPAQDILSTREENDYY